MARKGYELRSDRGFGWSTEGEIDRKVAHWRNTAPIIRDEDMPLGDGFSFPQMNAEKVKYVEAVRWQLQPTVLRWARERLIPWLTERVNRRSCDPSR